MHERPDRHRPALPRRGGQAAELVAGLLQAEQPGAGVVTRRGETARPIHPGCPSTAAKSSSSAAGRAFPRAGRSSRRPAARPAAASCCSIPAPRRLRRPRPSCPARARPTRPAARTRTAWPAVAPRPGPGAAARNTTRRTAKPLAGAGRSAGPGWAGASTPAGSGKRLHEPAGAATPRELAHSRRPSPCRRGRRRRRSARLRPQRRGGQSRWPRHSPRRCLACSGVLGGEGLGGQMHVLSRCLRAGVPHQVPQHQQVDPGRGQLACRRCAAAGAGAPGPRPSGPGECGRSDASQPRSTACPRSARAARRSTARSRNPPAAQAVDRRRVRRRTAGPPAPPVPDRPCRPPAPAGGRRPPRPTADRGPRRRAVRRAASAAPSRGRGECPGRSGTPQPRPAQGFPAIAAAPAPAGRPAFGDEPGYAPAGPDAPEARWCAAAPAPGWSSPRR